MDLTFVSQIPNVKTWALGIVIAIAVVVAISKKKKK